MGECHWLDCEHNAQGYCGLRDHIECPRKTSTTTYFLYDWTELPSYKQLELAGEIK